MAKRRRKLHKRVKEITFTAAKTATTNLMTAVFVGGAMWAYTKLTGAKSAPLTGYTDSLVPANDTGLPGNLYRIYQNYQNDMASGRENSAYALWAMLSREADKLGITLPDQIGGMPVRSAPTGIFISCESVGVYGMPPETNCYGPAMYSHGGGGGG